VTTDDHLDATVLAEYDEGLLAPPLTNEVEDHLAACASCSAVVARLGQVRARLVDSPTEITMPAAVAARIDDVLAAERAALDHDEAPARTATVHRFRRRLPQLLAAAATVGVVAFAGYVVSMPGGGDDSGGDTATSAEGAAEAGDGDENGAGRSRVEDDLAAGEAAPGQVLPAPDERTTLTEQIQTIAAVDPEAGADSALPQRLADDCGLVLAGELDTELIGVASTDVGKPGSVLVVVEADKPGLARGVVLPTCEAGLAEALRELTVPIE
jgi:hypothetical protein